MSKKLAIIGASDFQNPLILKAKEMGIETHVFAWESGDIGESNADYFYPISITEIDRIAEICREVGVDGICSIGTDLGNITVCSVADELGLCANSLECVRRSTNKHIMRETFAAHGDPSPWSIQVTSIDEVNSLDLKYPVIVKPVDRSGSRSITRLESADGLIEAVQTALDVSFAHAAVIEEFFEGSEYSVEYISWKGSHHFLALTKKYTTGAPHFIETGHVQPADIDGSLLERIKGIVSHALDSLDVQFGASHSEILINSEGDIRLVEIGSRMGGDCIGSDLVKLSTGVDFLSAVISVALNREPDLRPVARASSAMIRFIFSNDDLAAYNRVLSDAPQLLHRASVSDVEPTASSVIDSGSRYGFFILKAEDAGLLRPYLPSFGA